MEYSPQESDDEWHGLHPLSILVNLLPRMWSLVRSFWPLLIAFVYGAASRADFSNLIIVVVFFAYGVVGVVLHWATLRYRIYQGRLEIITGLVFRQERMIDLTRIQNVEVKQSIFHRMAGLAEVRLETASGKEAEGLLSALEVKQAQHLVDALREHRPNVADIEENIERVIQNRWSDLFRFGATSSVRIGGIVVILGILIELIPTGEQEWLREWVSGPYVLLVLPPVWMAAWWLGVATAMVQHFGFQLILDRGNFILEEGLFTKRRIQIEPTKIQRIAIYEPWIARLLGFASIEIVTAAAEPTGGTQRALIPVVEYEHIEGLIERLLGDNPKTALQPPAAQALYRTIVQTVVFTLMLAMALGTPVLFIGSFSRWALLYVGILAALMGITSIFLAIMDHRRQGWSVDGQFVFVRRGMVRRLTEMVPISKIQSVNVVQDFMLERHQLVNIRVRVAGSGLTLPLLEASRWIELSKQLQPITPSGQTTEKMKYQLSAPSAIPEAGE